MSKRRIFLAGYGLLVVTTTLLLASWVVWRVYVPIVMTDETALRFYAPAMTVTASLLIAVSLTGATVLTRIEEKEILPDLFLFFFAILTLVFGLFISAWGLASSAPQNWVVIAVPLTWVWGVLLLLGGIVWPVVHKPG